jgi:hypothetical protein
MQKQYRNVYVVHNIIIDHHDHLLNRGENPVDDSPFFIVKMEKQEQIIMMLTLLDSVYPSKKLFWLTCNDKWRVNFNMKNHPSRVYYMLDFGGLDETFMRE